MANKLKLESRERTEFGTTACRRLRRDQRIPANIYGHGETPRAISVTTDSLLAIIHAGQKLVDVKGASGAEKALLREVQWDAMGDEVLHVDLQRVSAGERIETEVTVETHGTAPGVVEGGSLEFLLHAIGVECPALSIPENFVINVNSLQMGQAIHVRDLEVPADVTVLADPGEIILQVAEPTEVSEEGEEEGTLSTSGEPEVVSKPAGAGKDEESTTGG